MKDKSAVVGLGYTEQGKLPGRSALSLYIEAGKNATIDAGLSTKDIDGLIIEPCPTDPRISAFSLAQEMGIELSSEPMSSSRVPAPAQSCSMPQWQLMQVSANIVFVLLLILLIPVQGWEA